MMNFPRRHNNKKSLFVVYLIFIAGVIFIVGTVPSISRFFSWGALAIATPFWRGENFIALSLEPYSALFSSKEVLVSENNLLKERNTFLEAESLKTNILVGENEELKKLLGRSVPQSPVVLGIVLSKPNRSPYDTLIVDVGREEGIRAGDKVLALGDVVVGLIEDVYPHTSRVKLFSSPDEKIDVVIGKNAIAATAEGIGGGNFEVKLPRGVPVVEGDTISFPSLSIETVGIVERIDAKPTDALQTIRFKNPINMFELKWVEVLISI